MLQYGRPGQVPIVWCQLAPTCHENMFRYYMWLETATVASSSLYSGHYTKHWIRETLPECMVLLAQQETLMQTGHWTL